MALGDKVSTGLENQGRSGVDAGWLTLKLYGLSNSRHGLAPTSLAMRKRVLSRVGTMSSIEECVFLKIYVSFPLPYLI